MESLSKLSVALATLLLNANSATAATAGIEILPLWTEPAVPVVTPDPPSRFVPPRPMQVPLPYHTGMPPQEWEALKTLAISDPLAEPADEIMPVPFASANTSTAAGDNFGKTLQPIAANSTVLTTFPGLDYATGGAITPDPIVAKSGFRVLQAVNQALRLYNTSGSVLATTTTQAFLGLSPTQNTSDPKVFFDKNGANLRFYFFVLEAATFNPQSSALWLAVSRTSNPSDFTSASWCKYRFNTAYTPPGGTATFADFPSLGVGADAVVATTNQYRFSDGVLSTTTLRAFSKVALSNNASSCPGSPSTDPYFFQPSAAGDMTVFTLQPAQHYTLPSSFSGTTNPIYLVSNHFLSMAGETRSPIYSVWRIRNVGTGAPSLNRVDVTALVNRNYQIPPEAPQLGTPIMLDTGDAGVRQLAGIGDSLWAAQSTLCTGDTSNQACVRVLRFDVGQDGSGNLTASIGQQLTFTGSSSTYFWMPGMAANSVQQTAVPFLFSSTTTYLSSAFTIKDASAGSYPASTVFGSGTCSRVGNFYRTGDYTGAQTNPNDSLSFWLDGDVAAISGSFCAWQTQVVNVTP
jgi:hypothetical protein